MAEAADSVLEQGARASTQDGTNQGSAPASVPTSAHGVPPTTMHGAPAVPDYLVRHYTWAYVDDAGVRRFERPWLVNLILLGNYRRLCDAALAEFSASDAGRCLQLACVYGALTPRLARRIGAGGTLDVVDALDVQLRNLARKLAAQSAQSTEPVEPADGVAAASADRAAQTAQTAKSAPCVVTLSRRDTAALGLPDASYDQVLSFFLLHEQPAEVRRRTLAEALRVLKPGGRLVLVDYHRPRWWHPLRLPVSAVLRTLEPFALDVWRSELADWLPAGFVPRALHKQTYFGGMYQKVVIVR